MSVQEIPASMEAERALIASCLRSRDAFYGVDVPPEAFITVRHQIIWREIGNVYRSKRVMECPLILAGMREQMIILEESDKRYVADLFKLKATEAPRYADIVLDKWWLRRAIDTFDDLLRKVQAPGAKKEDLRSEVEERFASMLKETSPCKGGKLSERLPAYLDELAGRAERLKKDGTAFGLPQLDATLGFHQPGDLLVIGSNSGKGKSLISLQGAIYNAKGRGIATGIISLEMEENQTYDRVFSHIGKISMNGFKTGEFTSEGLERIHQVHESLSTTPLWFYREKTDLESVKSRARRLCAIEGIKLLVIDYLQLIRLKHTRLSRQEQLEFISNDLKQFAHELGVVIWCPVQLNKDGDPRGAMDILQASDILFRLVMNKNSEVDGKMEIDKSRQGESSTIIPVSRKGWYMTIEENEE